LGVAVGAGDTGLIVGSGFGNGVATGVGAGVTGLIEGVGLGAVAGAGAGVAVGTGIGFGGGAGGGAGVGVTAETGVAALGGGCACGVAEPLGPKTPVTSSGGVAIIFWDRLAKAAGPIAAKICGNGKSIKVSS
jgi:hypothetical protein